MQIKNHPATNSSRLRTSVMLTRNSWIVLFVVALACIGFAIIWHRCKPELNNLDQDNTGQIETLRNEEEAIRKQVDEYFIQANSIEI